MKFIINSLQKKILLNKKLINKVFNTLNKNVADRLSNYELTVTFVDDKYIRRLNKRFLGKDRFTDVIAFPMEEISRPLVSRRKLPTIILGDVVISVDRAKVQAKRFRHSFDEELALLIIHGTLHLLGYDDIKTKNATLMRQKEQEILQILKFGRR